MQILISKITPPLYNGYMFHPKFVVGPQIEGPSTMTGQATYSVANFPSVASIKWTYTYTPSGLGSPIEIVGEDNKASIVIKEKNQFIDPIRPPVPGINSYDNILGDDISVESKLGGIVVKKTVTLKATITSGNYSYVLTKNIKIGESSKAISALTDSSDATSELTYSLLNEPQVVTESYRLVYENPVIGNSATIRVEKHENGEYLPYQGDYILSLQGERVGLVQQSVSGMSTCTFDCSSLPMGVYQLVLQINGQVASTSKMLKLY